MSVSTITKPFLMQSGQKEVTVPANSTITESIQLPISVSEAKSMVSVVGNLGAQASYTDYRVTWFNGAKIDVEVTNTGSGSVTRTFYWGVITQQS